MQFLLTETESPLYLLFPVVLPIHFGYLKCLLDIPIPILNRLLFRNKDLLIFESVYLHRCAIIIILVEKYYRLSQ